MINRQDYLDGKVTFEQYYSGLAKEHHIKITNLDLFGVRSLVHLRELYVKDKHLNNIPLRRFDALTTSYNAFNPQTRLSLADGTCIYKTLLKQMASITQQS